MTISTGAFDSFGIPQGSPNRLDDLADVDTLEAKEGNTIQQKGGRWVPADGNEVQVSSTQPEDQGVELWVNPTEDLLTEPVDPRYVAVAGDQMDGDLEVLRGGPVGTPGLKVGGIWGGTYPGVQALPTTSTSGGPAVLLGAPSGSGDNVYLIGGARGAGGGSVVLRPSNNTAKESIFTTTEATIETPLTATDWIQVLAADNAYLGVHNTGSDTSAQTYIDANQVMIVSTNNAWNTYKSLYLHGSEVLVTVTPASGYAVANKNYVDTRHGSVYFSLVQRDTDVAIGKDVTYQIAWSTQSTDANQRTFSWSSVGQSIPANGVYSGRLFVEAQHSVAGGRMTVEATSASGAGFDYGDRHSCYLANSWYRFSTSFTRAFNVGDVIGGRVIAHDGSITLGIARCTLAGPFESKLP